MYADAEAPAPPAGDSGRRSRSRSPRRDHRDRDKDRDRDRSRRSRSRSRGRRRRSSRSRSRGRSRRRRSRSRDRRSEERRRERREKRKKAGGNWDQKPPEGQAAVPFISPGGRQMQFSGGVPMLGDNRQLTKKARTIYVGNVQYEMTEPILREFFNQRVASQAGRPPSHSAPVDSLNINHAKMYCFLEFNTMTDADIALALDGAVLCGHPLRVRRPKDYQPVAGHVSKKWQAAGVISTHVEDGPGKIFMGGLPPELTDEELKPIVGAFGELAAFTLVKDTQTGQPKGYAFFAYKDISVSQGAVGALDGMNIAGKAITCKMSRAAVESGAHAAPLDPAAALEQQRLMLAINGGIGGAAMGLGLPLPPSLPPAPVMQPSTVVAMQNMVTAAELSDPEEYADIVADVKEECGNYGVVKTVLVPKPSGANQADVGMVFVEFGDVDSAVKGQAAVHGRKFGGRTILATFITEAEFAGKVKLGA